MMPLSPDEKAHLITSQAHAMAAIEDQLFRLVREAVMKGQPMDKADEQRCRAHASAVAQHIRSYMDTKLLLYLEEFVERLNEDVAREKS